MAIIREEEISLSSLSLLDPLGHLFRWNGGLYRGIYPRSAEMIRSLFASGCLDELAVRGLFPNSRVTEHTLEGFGLVVQHEEIPLVAYPDEWSFDMLRDAALATLDLAEVSAPYGWEVSDLHPYNIVFKSGYPMYVDLGSFRPIRKGQAHRKRSDFHKFIKTFWRPLLLWARGDTFFARSILSSTEPHLPDVSWWLYQNSALRVISPRNCVRLARRTERWFRNASRRSYGILSLIPSALASRLPVELLVRNPPLLRQKIARLNQSFPKRPNRYRAPIFSNGHSLEETGTDWILKIIRSLDCESATDLAGGPGALTYLMATKTQIKKLVCIDPVGVPVNDFYNYCRSYPNELHGCYVQCAVLDFMAPKASERLTPSWVRLRSQLVVALGVTDRLILARKYPLRDILSMIAGYTSRYAIIDFMPLGMGTAANSDSLPSWYTTDWFLRHFAEFFDLVAEEQIQSNRIVFVGHIKHRTDSLE